LNKKNLIKPIALALKEAASFCAGVRHKRYSGQQETAPHKKNGTISPKRNSPVFNQLKKEK
jgi:hypothetical protein